MHPTQVAAILHEHTQLQVTVSTRTLWHVGGQHQVMCGVSGIVAKTSTVKLTVTAPPVRGNVTHCNDAVSPRLGSIMASAGHTHPEQRANH